MYTKTQPHISFDNFFKIVCSVTGFKSITGKGYIVTAIEGTKMNFIREETGEPWSMDLQDVHKAYKELKDFKTINFKPYVPRKQSPALGLLLHMGLLKQ